MPDIYLDPADVKKGVEFGNPTIPETGEYVGDLVIDVLTGAIIVPLNENDALILGNT